MPVPTKENREYLTSNGDAEDKFAGYDRQMVIQDDSDHDMDDGNNGYSLTGQYTASADVLNEHTNGAYEDSDLVTNREKAAQIASRETDYQKRRFNRALSPRRADPLAENGASEGETLKETLARRELERDEARVKAILRERETNGDNSNGNEHAATLKTEADKENGDAPRKRKRRWDNPDEDQEADAKVAAGNTTKQKPVVEETKPKKRSRFDTAAPVGFAGASATKGASRWEQAPAPGAENAANGPVPVGLGFSQDYTRRNIPLSDKELDILLPGPEDGYEIVEPPANYAPAMMRKAAEAILPAGGFMMQQSVNPNMMGKELPTEIPGVGELQFFKESDMQYFGDLMKNGNDDDMSVDELKQRKIMRLLLKIKNGTPPMRKTALRQITDNARQFGARPLLDQILPLLMEKTLEDQERHLLVKVIDRILYKLDDQIREEVHRILTVIEPMLLDQDHYARVEGREIISNLAKAAGLATMIAHMRPQIDSPDEYVRNSTARSFAIVASALGIQTLIPFLRAVCRSKKSWTARHTGVKIIQQIAILQGNGVLPHLKGLVECIGSRLNDEQVKVKTITALAIAALAEASSPYGIEAFDQILEPLWDGARRQRGKGLTGFLKAIGHIIPLMGEEYTTYYVTQITPTVLREFTTPDEEMKQVVLRVVQQIAQTQGVQPSYLKETVLPDFLKCFWIRRMALERRNYRQVVDTTVVVGGRVGPGIIIDKIVKHLKDDSESFRKMAMETIDRLLAAQGAADIDARLEERLIDGALHAFQEQGTEEQVVLNGFGTIVSSLDARVKPYLPQIASTILWRLNHKVPGVRQQAADLIARIAQTMRACGEDTIMVKLSQVLYEYLGEEYPDVLGSILGAMRSIVTVVGLSEMQPPIRDLLPRLTPILRNRHERVQENTIDLIGRIADRGPDAVSPREWMRICFELLDMLKAHKKGIRRAANNTFGYIAKAIGPQDVLSTLLNNLRVQERQSRVCTAVAIGIIAETCAPFTILPALMNEYRVPELNVQNGVLKALSFLFEYIGDMAKDYVYAVTPLLEDALIDRDQVHRQTAASVVKHLALGVVGLGCEDAMLHLLNLVFPNIFETSPHVINRVIEAIEGIRNAVGPGAVLNYTWSGLFHPARKVRVPYWRVYNDSYVQQADAMVPYYPDGSDIGSRAELMVIL